MAQQLAKKAKKMKADQDEAKKAKEAEGIVITYCYYVLILFEFHLIMVLNSIWGGSVQMGL